MAGQLDVGYSLLRAAHTNRSLKIFPDIILMKANKTEIFFFFFHTSNPCQHILPTHTYTDEKHVYFLLSEHICHENC